MIKYKLKWCSLVTFLLSFLSSINGQESQPWYDVGDFSDGACDPDPPRPIDITVDIERWFPEGYFIPRASAAYYRFHYELAFRHPVNNDNDIQSMRPAKVKVSHLHDTSGESEAHVEEPEGNQDSWCLKCIPSREHADLRDTIRNCTVLDSSKGKESESPVGNFGQVEVRVLWVDMDRTATATGAWLEWLCVGGQKMFRILSRHPFLEDHQVSSIADNLYNLGFNERNFQEIH